jgi:eukaryotic-like serine/threonine-protein kinase
VLGRTVGNYVVERKLGEGGMGAVYLARHPRIGKEVAIKVLLPQLSRDPELVQRFFHEAKAAAEIKNEHIVDVLDYGELSDGASYIVMEWLEGRSLSELLRAETKLPLARAQKIARGIGRALAAAHTRGIVHRDLKPDNIFLVRHEDDPDFVKVLDFGIAKLMGDATDVKTRAGAILGTPYYMSPEQCQGFAVDPRADVYSLGVILYQMVTGRLPFEAAGLGELLMAHVSRPPPPPRTLEPGLPLAAEEALLQALAKDPEQRFSRVEALVIAFCGDTMADWKTPAAALPPALPPATTAPPPPAAEHGRTSELFLRIGVRGKRGFAVGAGVVLVVVAATALLVGTRRLAATGDGSATPPSGAATAPAASDYGGTWRLARTDCLPGAMPRQVTVTQSGRSFSVLGGVPTTGEIAADGHFTARNSLGTCRGQVTGRVSKETCTNALRQSCHATYERAD